MKIVCLLACLAGVLAADSKERRLSATLTGYEEVGPVSTTAKGRFAAQVNAQETSIAYELEYSGFATPVVMAHIHFGQPAVNGGIVVWLCGTTNAPGPSGTPVCPASGKVTGTITAAQVGNTSQGIAQGQFAKLLDAVRAGVTYVNLHSNSYPSGEIRGQVNDRGEDNDDNNGRGRDKE